MKLIQSLSQTLPFLVASASATAAVDKVFTAKSKCSSEPHGWSSISADGIPDIEGLAKGASASAYFPFKFSSDLSEMTYQLTINDENFVSGQDVFVSNAFLYCTDPDYANGISIADIAFDPTGATKLGTLTKDKLYTSIDGQTTLCGEIEIETMASLYQAIVNRDVAVVIQVTDFATQSEAAFISGTLDITEVGGATESIFSPGSGCVMASQENVLCRVDPENCTKDPLGLSFFVFSFLEDLSGMLYRTGSAAESTLGYDGLYFLRGGLYCGNAGEDNPNMRLADIEISGDGSVLEGMLNSTRTGAECPLGTPIKTLVALREVIANGLAYYEIDTAGSGGLGTVRGQLILNKD